MDCAQFRLTACGAARPSDGVRSSARENKNRTRSAPMTLKASLYVTVAAIGIASFVWAAPLRAQTAVAIDNDDIGGVSYIPKNITRENWLRQMNNVDCIDCHQLGQQATRTIPAAFGEFKSGAEAWQRRIQSGQTGEAMTNRIAGQFGGVPFKYFGDWTDRVAKGELPKSKPPRPQGVERNVVVSSWEWSTEKLYLHDLISSDRRNPTVNAYGPLYDSPEYSTDNMPTLHPKTSQVTFFKMPVADPKMPESLGPGHAASIKPLQASAYWGDEKTWDTRANNHNAMFDKKGRVWIAATVRGLDNPA